MLIVFDNKFECEYVFIDNKIYFKAKDVCRILGFKNHRDALNTHCNKKGVASADSQTNGGIHKSTFINEANLYSLIFNVPKTFKIDTEEVKNTKQRAEKFKWYIFEEVLPQIRKTGKYEKTEDDIINNPFYQYTKRDTQIQKSKEINALNFALGGVEKIIEYNRANVLQCTGLTTKEVKSLGKKLGLKSKITQSAKETARNIDEFKAKACTMALNDDVIQNNKNIKLEDLIELDKNATKTFQSLLDIGVKPEELNRKN